MSQLARQLIAENKRTKAKSLDLGNCGLTDLEKQVPQLSDCVWLEELNLGEWYWSENKNIKTNNKGTINKIGNKTAFIFIQLPSLKKIHLEDNNISDAAFLAGFKNLHTLTLAHNQIDDIRFLKNLINLHTLNLSRNQINKYSFLTKLNKLQNLFLNGNRIKNISFLQNLTQLQTLNLYGNQINDISSLQNLTQLQTLDLYENQISDISFLKNLTQLQTLDLYGNQISDISSLQNLTQLQFLHLNGNQIKDINSLQNLTQLQTLDLYGNQINDISFLQGLTQLQTLNLNKNQVTNISSLQNLTQLKILGLNGNQINDITPLLPIIQREILVNFRIKGSRTRTRGRRKSKKIKKKKTVRNNGKESINLSGNPITTPPIEIVQEGNQAILNYFEELELQGSEVVYEAKLLILGEAGAGKTSLKRKIGNCEATLPDEEKDTTTGIEITQHSFAATTDLPEFKMNIWDFGGQAVYHATHQFFLSKRSLYVLVDDGRKEDNNSYWMQIQELFGQGSPLLLFLNQKGTIQRQIPLNDLKGEFPNIRGDLEVINLKSEADKIPDYCRTLEFYIRNLPQFKQGETLPKKWVRIREALEAREENYISLSRFRQICRKQGINEAKRQDFLSDYLHDLGVMLHFQDSPLLKRMVVLKPEWATNAVYAILNHTEERGKDGQFTYADLNEVWQSHEYEDVFEELLALMQKFELCYRLKHDKERFIVPQLLPKDKPDFEWKNERNLQLRYEYDFMPKGIITRFIVRRHKFIEAQKLVWQRGVVLKYKKARALVVEEYRNKAINIRIEGKFPQDLMTIITDEIDDINSGFHFNERMKVRKMVPCICPTCSSNSQQNKPFEVYAYDKLMEKLEKGKHRYYCNTGDEFFDILEALRNIGDSGKRKSSYGFGREPVFEGAKMPKRVFIAYDDADEAHLKALTKHLKSLEKNGQLQTWSVNQTIVGSNEQQVLDQKLSEAEVVLLLISVDFVNSDTCVEHILKVAVDKHNEGLAQVVPIYVRPCDCEGMAFENLKALPNDTTQPQYVAQWQSKDSAWLNVAKGIKESLKV